MLTSSLNADTKITPNMMMMIPKIWIISIFSLSAIKLIITAREILAEV